MEGCSTLLAGRGSSAGVEPVSADGTTLDTGGVLSAVGVLSPIGVPSAVGVLVPERPPFESLDRPRLALQDLRSWSSRSRSCCKFRL